jgi:putative ABC transport system substrate-binding protein
MRRRDFISILGGTAAWPLAARAQQPAIPVIGYLSSRTAESDVPMLTAIREGLGAAGFTENRNIAIKYRFADGQYDRHAALVADLVRQHVAVIASVGNVTASLSAKAATSTIPIVFNTGGDPIQAGLVRSINRPGGNATGVVTQTNILVGKSMGLLRELVPNARTIAVLANPTASAFAEQQAEAREAAATLGLQMRRLEASTVSGIDEAFASLAREPADVMQVPVDPFFLTRATQIVALAARYQVPAIYVRRPFAEVGGLITYGDDVAYSYRQMGVYIGRILKGEKPADLPVVQTNKFELVINLKTAKALGLEVPAKLLALADDVIE